MDFADKAVYEQLERKKDERGFEIVTLPAGSRLYRTSKSGKTTWEHNPELPVFLGDRAMVTTVYGKKTWDDAVRALFQYTTTTPANLMVMTLANLKKLAEGGDETGIIQKYYLAPRTMLPPSVFANHKEPLRSLAQNPDTPIIVPAQITDVRNDPYRLRYANRDLAKIVCARGFHGWIVFPNSVVQYDPSTNTRGVVSIYHHEVALCPGAGGPPTTVKLEEFMGGRRRAKTRRWKMPRKMSRAYCRKTPCRRMGFTQRASCRPYKNCFTRRRRSSG